MTHAEFVATAGRKTRSYLDSTLVPRSDSPVPVHKNPHVLALPFRHGVAHPAQSRIGVLLDVVGRRRGLACHCVSGRGKGRRWVLLRSGPARATAACAVVPAQR
jgi:hypothetical protein